MKYAGFLFLLLIILSCNGKQQNANVNTKNESVTDSTVQKEQDEQNSTPATKDDADKSEKVDIDSEVVKNNSDLEKMETKEETVPKKEVKKEKEEVNSEKENVSEQKAKTPSKPKEKTILTSKIKESNKVPKVNVEPREEKNPMPAPEKPKEAAFNHIAWDQLLRKYVSASGNVDYSGFKKDEATLDSYLKGISENLVKETASRSAKMAYWINAYNAYTVKLILENFPLSSITKLHNGKPWDKKWINIEGKSYSLNNIENDILRPKYKDARIHFAVNCAARSCPPLLNRAWTKDNLESNFEKQTKSFINNPAFNETSTKECEVSKIFDWYKEDFGMLNDFLDRYSETTINSKTKIKFKEYDWALNGK